MYKSGQRIVGDKGVARGEQLSVVKVLLTASGVKTKVIWSSHRKMWAAAATRAGTSHDVQIAHVPVGSDAYSSRGSADGTNAHIHPHLRNKNALPLKANVAGVAKML